MNTEVYASNEHQEGNNILTRKTIRVNIPLYDSTDLTKTSLYGRYYLPETPELKGKTIVGIKFNLGQDPTDNIYGFPQSLMDLPKYIVSENTSGITQEVSNLLMSGTVDFSKYMFLNIKGNNNELILDNYPCNRLSGFANGGNIISHFAQIGKIIPFDIKINPRDSYILLTCDIINSGLLTGYPIACLTFYYI